MYSCLMKGSKNYACQQRQSKQKSKSHPIIMSSSNLKSFAVNSTILKLKIK